MKKTTTKKGTLRAWINPMELVPTLHVGTQNTASSVPDQETPRMKCLREANEALHRCMASAKTEAQKSECTKALQAALAKCPSN